MQPTKIGSLINRPGLLTLVYGEKASGKTALILTSILASPSVKTHYVFTGPGLVFALAKGWREKISLILTQELEDVIMLAVNLLSRGAASKEALVVDSLSDLQLLSTTSLRRTWRATLGAMSLLRMLTDRGFSVIVSALPGRGGGPPGHLAYWSDNIIKVFSIENGNISGVVQLLEGDVVSLEFRVAAGVGPWLRSS